MGQEEYMGVLGYSLVFIEIPYDLINHAIIDIEVVRSRTAAF